MYFWQTQFAFILQPVENTIKSETHIGRRHADLRHPALDDGVGVGRSWDQWKERPGLADGGKLGSDLKGPPVVRDAVWMACRRRWCASAVWMACRRWCLWL